MAKKNKVALRGVIWKNGHFLYEKITFFQVFLQLLIKISFLAKVSIFLLVFMQDKSNFTILVFCSEIFEISGL